MEGTSECNDSMTSPPGPASRARPVLFRLAAAPKDTPKRRGGSGGRVAFRNIEQRLARLEGRFEEARASFDSEVALATSLQASDPQLVLVFEALDTQIELAGVAQTLGFEILAESEGAVEPSEEFVLTSLAPRSPLIGSYLHAVCINQQAFDRLRALWTAWTRDRTLDRGYAPLRDLFLHLRDVRPWGPQDRLKAIDWDTYFATQLGDEHAIGVELWYRKTAAARAEGQRAVETLIERAHGTVLASSQIEQIGYHAIQCTVPTALLASLARRQFDQVQLVRSTTVMYLRISGQQAEATGPETDADVTVTEPGPSRPPVLCLLDGVPATNHPLLAGRVEIFDPDDWAGESPVTDRKHGTSMASVAVWGDRCAHEPPAERIVLVRPILIPSAETRDRVEELPGNELVPDLMWRVFRELFEPQDAATPAAPQIAIVNLSVGDPAAPFEAPLSSWARIIDWLSYHYGVLIVVAAGNHGSLELAGINTDELLAMSGEDRRRAILHAQNQSRHQRRLLSPAESINALTVGAVHFDASGVAPVGYTADPTDGLPSLSPVTALGPGYRRSVKPELVAEGGRVLFRCPAVPSSKISFTSGSSLGPGIKVAVTGTGRETFTAGTSAAAALVSRQAVRLYDLIDEISAGTALTRRQRAAAIKALLVHASGEIGDFDPNVYLEHGRGNGALTRDFADGCAENEAVLLVVGALGASQEQDLSLPLPDGLSVRETKRIEATLAWLSPINWRHRQYRRAALSLVKPAGAIPALGHPIGLSSDTITRGATTVQHASWEIHSAFAAGQGSELTTRVKCSEQAGGLQGESVDYAVVLSLWVAPTINVDVYSQVRDQIRGRVIIGAQDGEYRLSP